MTTREFLNAVIEGTITEEHIDYAKERIAKLDERLARAKENKQSTPSKAATENAELAAGLYPLLEAGTTYTAEDLCGLLNVKNKSKATAVIKVLVAEDKVEVTEVKRKNARPVNGYVVK